MKSYRNRRQNRKSKKNISVRGGDYDGDERCGKDATVKKGFLSGEWCAPKINKDGSDNEKSETKGFSIMPEMPNLFDNKKENEQPVVQSDEEQPVMPTEMQPRVPSDEEQPVVPSGQEQPVMPTEMQPRVPSGEEPNNTENKPTGGKRRRSKKQSKRKTAKKGGSKKRRTRKSKKNSKKNRSKK